MNVIVDGIVYSLQKHGGISVYFNELIKNICFFSDIDLNLILYPNNSHALKEIDLFNVSCTKYRSRFLERYRNVSFSNMQNNKKSIFHSSYYRIGCARNLLNVTTVHDFIYEKYFRGYKKSIHAWQKRHAVLHSDYIICVSENTRNDLLNFYPEVDPSKIQVIYNGVGEHFHLLKDDSKKKQKNDYVIYIGSRYGYKNFETAVTSVSLDECLQLYIIGGGELNAFEVDLLNKKLPQRYKFLGFTNDSALNELYNNAFCLLYPSLYEGFGIPALEAMKAGCPVIAMDSSSIPEVCGNAAILVKENSPEAFSLALNKLKKGNFRKDLIEKALLHAENFSWNKMANETISLYKRLLEVE
ncbi:glycosyltransferase family 4 protein [Kosakonia pseudosacchari]|uniref:glycosyltransferase family 4 protein n=1 Tax=Kosakonia pseudosacchari TaxID=1646340 RepID=UPI000A3BDC4C|nr:glycosyltransferase family 1 protein [Kosakonia pseudosacchari]